LCVSCSWVILMWVLIFSPTPSCPQIHTPKKDLIYPNHPTHGHQSFYPCRCVCGCISFKILSSIFCAFWVLKNKAPFFLSTPLKHLLYQYMNI
jgi:hypothetical protein